MASPFFKRTGRVNLQIRETAPAQPMFPGRPQYTGTWVPGRTRDLSRRNWFAVPYGIEGAVSTVPAGRWVRGGVFRFLAPTLTPPVPGFFMYDPTSVELTPGVPSKQHRF